MPGMSEGCSVCGRTFDVQFRYQMEEREGGFAFFCSQACQAKSLHKEEDGGVACDACHKIFVLELVSQIVRVKGTRRHACSDACRNQLLAEAGGVRLGALLSTPSVAPAPTQGASATSTSSPTTTATLGTSTATATPTTTTSPTPTATPTLGTATPTSIAPPTLTAVSTPPPPPSASVSTLPPPAPITTPPPRSKMHAPRRLAIFNHKGGTGKTTTSVSLAAGLAARGLRVLLVDTDSQGNVGVSLGVKAERSLYHVLVMGLKPSDAVVNIRPNLDLIVSNETVAAAELYLAGRQNRDRILRDRLLAVADAYDVLLLDCSPSLSLMNQNALVLAEGIVVPVACDFLSLVGVRQVIKTVKNVNSLLHHPVQITGILPTFYDGRARICRDAVDTLRQHFGDRTLTPIRQTIKVKEAPAQGKTIFEYAPESNAAEDYRRAVDQLVEGPNAVGYPFEPSASADAELEVGAA